MAERKKQKRDCIRKSFPCDLVDDLLVRLPTKSLLRFKCVSKSWHALITSSGFRKKHLITINSVSNTSNDGHRIILSSHRSVQSINFGACGGGGGIEKRATTFEFPLKHPQSQEMASEFEVVGSCNGLVCLVTLKDSSVILWNPCIGEYKILSLAQPQDNQILLNSYGFGYDPSSDDYKVLRFVFRSAGTPVYILSLKTETWKRTQSLPICLGSYKLRGTFLDGVLYWIGGECIVGFDLRDEKFELVNLPNPLVDAVQLGVYQGRLFLVSAESGIARVKSGIVLWVKHDKEQKWTQLMRISSSRLYKLGYVGERVWYPIFLTRNGQVLMSHQTVDAGNFIVFWVCSPSIHIKLKGKRICMTRKFRWEVTELNLPRDCWLHRFQLMTYIETLVSPNLL